MHEHDLFSEQTGEPPHAHEHTADEHTHPHGEREHSHGHEQREHSHRHDELAAALK